MPYLTRGNLRFYYLDRGSGTPVVFQHGLGGNIDRIFEQITLPDGFRLLGFDCRAHGKTTAPMEASPLSFDLFADDLAAFLEHLGVEEVIAGGTSMGAGVALNFTLRYTRRVCGLVLLRPAWLDRPNEANLNLFSEIARCLRQFGSEKGLVVFKQTDAYRQLQAQSSDAAASISDLFSDPTAVDTIQRLERIPMDAPNRDRGEWKRIHVPTLVLGCRQDPIHPYEYARTLAQAIPGAEFKELTPKCVSVTRYLGELNEALRDFLAANYPGKD